MALIKKDNRGRPKKFLYYTGSSGLTPARFWTYSLLTEGEFSIFVYKGICDKNLKKETIISKRKVKGGWKVKTVSGIFMVDRLNGHKKGYYDTATNRK